MFEKTLVDGQWQSRSQRRKPPSEAEIVARESERQSGRDRIKQELSEVQERQEKITRLETAIDAITDQHHSTCGPLQDELAAIPPDDHLRRAEVKSKIQQANKNLENALAELHKDRHALAMENAKAASPSDLLRLASIPTRARVMAAQHRSQRASRLVQTLSDQIRNSAEGELFHESYKIELQTAEAELKAAQEESAEAMKEAIDE